MLRSVKSHSLDDMSDEELAALAGELMNRGRIANPTEAEKEETSDQ
jgi:hypothetical protein